MGSATILGRRVEEEPSPQQRRATLWVLGMLGLAGLVAVAGYFLGFLGTVNSILMPGNFQAFGLVTLALAIGTAAFFSPCAFPLLPAYAAYAIEAQQGSRGLARSLKLGLVAGAGLSVVVLAVGMLIALLGAAAPFQPDPRQDPWWLLGVRVAAGLAIAAFGLLTLTRRTGVLSRFFHAIQRPQRQTLGSAKGPARGMFLFGLAYSGAGIGCTGPLLLALMLYAFAFADPALALLGFAVFAATMAGLMVLVTGLVGLARSGTLQRLRAATPSIQRIGGAVTLAVGAWTVLSVTVATELFVRFFFPFLPR